MIDDFTSRDHSGLDCEIRDHRAPLLTPQSHARSDTTAASVQRLVGCWPCFMFFRECYCLREER